MSRLISSRPESVHARCFCVPNMFSLAALRGKPPRRRTRLHPEMESKKTHSWDKLSWSCVFLCLISQRVPGVTKRHETRPAPQLGLRNVVTRLILISVWLLEFRHEQAEQSAICFTAYRRNQRQGNAFP
eukprot:473174-Rhodomonas_salina.2